MEQPGLEPGQVAGRDVLILTDDASSDPRLCAPNPCPDVQSWHILVSGDTIWLVRAEEKLLIEAFDKLAIELTSKDIEDAVRDLLDNPKDFWEAAENYGLRGLIEEDISRPSPA